MTNKPLKHFKRKKFFYRLFMRKSPRSGAMLGVAWMGAIGALMPFLFLPLMISMGSGPEGWKVAIVLIFVCFIPLYVYSMVLCGIGVNRICRGVIKSGVASSVATGIGVYFLPLLGLVLCPVLLRRKKFFAVVPALAGTVCYLLSYSTRFNGIGCVCLGMLLYLATLALIPDKQRISRLVLIPLVIAISASGFLIGYDWKLQREVVDLRNTLSQIVGRSVEIADFWKRDAGGFSADFEPLKTLLATQPEADYSEYRNKEEARAKLLAYQKKNPVFIQALDKFLQLPICAVSHKKPEDGLMTSIMMPEMNLFREVSVYLVLKIAADPEDKENVRICNQHLIELRERMLKGPFYISYLVALSIEGRRLKVLANVLSEKIFSKAEICQLIGDPVDWEKYLKFAYGDEIASFKTVLDCLQTAAAEGSANKYPGIRKYTPLFLRVYFLRDYRFALKSFVKGCSLPAGLSGMEKMRMADIDDLEIRRRGYVISGMMLPAIFDGYGAVTRVEDFRLRVLVATEVAEYGKLHGSLPENLSFLSEIPRSKLDHRQLMYEKTAAGFRIYSYTLKGEKAKPDDGRYSFEVKW